MRIGSSINEQVLSKFEQYIKELCIWSKRINLTGLKREADIAITLFVDSLACGLSLSPEKNETVLDVGSGAGFPGIPLKIAFPGLEVTLVEPHLKKVAFLHHIIGTLDVGSVEVIPRRVEDIARDKSFTLKFDRLVTKALKPESILPFGSSLLRSQGKVVLFRSQPLNIPVHEFGMRLIREVPYELPNGFGKRILSLLEQL